MRIKRHRAKPKPRPKINYPPVPTRKWIPPDKRKKPPKPEPKYIKPEGVTQKLAVSNLSKVWHQYKIIGNFAVLTGHFSQTHKRFTFRTNGLQGACNAAMACIFSSICTMEDMTKHHLDQILILGNDLYLRSTLQGDRCLIEIPPDKIYTTFYLGDQKISFEIDDLKKVVDRTNSIAEEKIKNKILCVLETFFKKNVCGIFASLGKYVAIWIKMNAYYYFDPTEHTETGSRWDGIPGLGFCLLCRCKNLTDMVNVIFYNFDMKTLGLEFEILPVSIDKLIKLNVTPPENFEDIVPHKPQPIDAPENDPPPPMHPVEQALLNYVQVVEEDPEEVAQKQRVEEISHEVTDDLPPSKRPSWLQGNINKTDKCKYPIPKKKLVDIFTHYVDAQPLLHGILRAVTCQTDQRFSKYKGRQSMGNAISALIMLRLYKSEIWTSEIVNTILKHGDLIYRDAMISIPRNQSLKLSDFPKKIEYEGRFFTPVVDEFAVVGKLQSLDFEILDLFPALDIFLRENDCCVVQGPQILAVWVENGSYYMFDPNERNSKGKTVVSGQNECPGVACVTRYTSLKDLVHMYMENTKKEDRNDQFYLSKVQITDYVELPEAWYNFKGIAPSKWLLRGTISQANFRFSEYSRNFQGPANALMALAKQLLFDAKEWSEEFVDNILVDGDELYISSVRALMGKEKFIKKELLLNEVNSACVLGDKRVEFLLVECLINGLIYAKKSNDLPDLTSGLEEFFRDNDTCVVTTRHISLAIWKKDDMFYYFDPYSRDDKGLPIGYGTACVVRMPYISEMAKAIEENLNPDVEDFFNINKVQMEVYDATEGGAVKPALNHYTKLTETSAILRSIYSEITTKYGIHCGKQTIPMMMCAVGFNKLKPSTEWTKKDVDELLNKGDHLYSQCMAEVIKPGENAEAAELQPVIDIPADKPTDETEEEIREETGSSGTAEPEIEKEEVYVPEPGTVTSDNVITNFDFGPNNISIEFGEAIEGNIKAELQEALRTFFEREQTEDDFNHELLLEGKYYNVVLWRDDKVFYLFDSKPRDKNGQVIGKEDWLPEYEAPPPAPKKKEKKKRKHYKPKMLSGEGDIGDDLLNYIGEDEGESDTESDEEGIVYPPLVTKSPSFWLEQEKMGKACVMWFMNIDDLITHIFENIPPKKRPIARFVLKPVTVINTLQLKNVYNPVDDRLDVYAGDWYYFKEIEHGRWILRGTGDMTSEMFPETNRGRQNLTTAVCSLACAYVFGMVCFTDTTVDAILSYGDKLYSFIKRLRLKQLQGNRKLNLKEDEIEWLVEHEELEVNDILNKICISKFMVDLKIEPEVVTGDVKAQNFEEIFDVARGLEEFFAEHKYGILCSKDLCVGIWRGEKIYFMFDGNKRGPNGVKSTVGVACITRFLDINHMSEVFLANLPKQGRNKFCIHNVEMQKELCPRKTEPKLKVEMPKTVAKTPGFKDVVPGKSVLRGTMHQEDAKFGKGPNVLSAPIAVIALTMTLLHKTETWARPIVDEILILGCELYNDSVEALGFDFNPWEDQLDLYRVKNEYKLGVVRADCELRNTVQKGIIATKDPEVQNIRVGIERFFEENTHGVIVSEVLTVAIWEEQPDSDEKVPVIYIFDPNPRGPTGMPLFTGTACVIRFANAKMAADHILNCILDPAKRAGEFVIVPVEIVVDGKTNKKAKKTQTKSNVSLLPRCSELAANETAKKLRKISEEARKRKEAKRLALLGRQTYYITKSGEGVLRGHKCETSEAYSPDSRGNQDIPNCIVSVIMNTLESIDTWTHRTIDQILDTGDQLYIDSYIAYSPTDAKLGMQNVVRKIFIKNYEVHVTIYKPVISDFFTANNISRILNSCFQQETCCLLNYKVYWVSVFFKAGYYYVFDPHERDLEGNKLKPKKPEPGSSGSKETKQQEKGAAVVIRFNSLDDLGLRLVHNLIDDLEESTKPFTLWLMSVEIKT